MKRSKEATAYTVDNSLRKEKLGQEPAFPLDKESSDMITNGYGMDERYLGMSKRFYAACAAMQGLLSSQVESGYLNSKEAARRSFLCADELLKQENE